MGKELAVRMALAAIAVCIAFLLPQACPAANLLVNPGFEDPIELKGSWVGVWVDKGWKGSWGSSASTTYTVKESHYIGDTACGDFHPHSGNNAISFSTEGSGESVISQRILVVPESQYTASVYVKAYDYSGNNTGFGAASTDLAGLLIREYDFNGNLKVTHEELAVTAPTDFVQLSTGSFTTGKDTYYIDYQLRGVIACHWSKGRVCMDDAVLDGPAGSLPLANVTGVVSAGGSPVSGATVKINNTTSVTGANGVYSIEGVPTEPLGVRVSVECAGYLAQSKYPVLATGSNTVDFALDTPPSNNLLVNGDFEIGGPYGTAANGGGGIDNGWSFQLWGDGGSYLRRESLVNRDAPEPAGVSGPWQPHGGNEASRHCASGHGLLLAYQELPVVPSSPYTASVWVKARNFDDLGFGVVGSGDYAGLHIQEYAGSTLVVDHPIVSITTPTDWTKLTYPFTTGTSTTKVMYFLETMIGGLWSGYGHWQHGQVIYDDAVLDGATAFATLSGTVTAEGQPLEGATVTVAGKSATTGADGAYVITDIPAQAEVRQIVTSCAGYGSANSYMQLGFGQNSLDIELYPLPANQLLTNGDFENPGAPYIAWGNNGAPQANSGWTCRLWSVGSAYLRRESTVFKYNNGYEPDGVGPGPWQPYSGTQCSRQTANPGGQHEISQTVWATPGAYYKASVMARCVNLLSGDYVSLHITELDADGNIVADHAPVTTDSAQWTRLVDEFEATSWTEKIKYALYTSLSVHWSVGWANYDAAVLDGVTTQPPVATVTGTVKLGTSPMAGATVTVRGKTGVSGPDGVYRIEQVPASDDLTAVTVQLDGYVSENKWRTIPRNTTVTADFDLIALPANNLLVNPDFEQDQAPYVAAEGSGGIHYDQGWTGQLWVNPANGGDSSYLRRESSLYTSAGEPQGVGNGPWVPHSGHEASRHCTSSGGHITVYQDLMVVPSTLYKASVWLKATDIDGLGFGADIYGDSAGLHITEYALDGSVVLDHTPVVVNTATDWTRLADEFRTQPNTARVRYMMETYIGGLWSGWGHWQHGWVTYDTCAFDGPTCTATLSGVVTRDGSPVEGATVAVAGKTATTEADGSYSIAAVTVTQSQYTVVASHPECYTESKTVSLVNGANTLDFDLCSLPVNNLLANPGFEEGYALMLGSDGASGVTHGWTAVFPNAFSYSVEEIHYGASAQFHSGSNAMSHSTESNGESISKQTVCVVPGAHYRAFVFAKGWDYSGNGTGFGAVGTTDSAGLQIKEYDAAGNLLLAHDEVKITSPGGYTLLKDSFTASSATRNVEFILRSVIHCNYAQGRTSFDDAALDGPSCAVFEPVSTIAELKAKADETSVRIADKVVTAAFDGFFYIEEQDRTNGIKVTGNASAGEIVTIIGTVRTVNGERTLVSESVDRSTGGAVPAPLGMNNRAVAAEGGLSGVGLYITTWGRVDSVGGSPFTITDGNGANLKVYAPAGYSATANDYVKVIGALGAELSGGDVVPVVRAVSVTKAD